MTVGFEIKIKGVFLVIVTYCHMSFGCGQDPGQEPEVTGRSGWRSGLKPKSRVPPLSLLLSDPFNNNYIIHKIRSRDIIHDQY